MNKKTLETVKKLTEELIEKIGIDGKVLAEEKDEAILIKIETPESALLIGFHGETLASLQLVLSLMVYKKLGEWTRIVVNVGDYRERREEILQQMAERAAEKVVSLGEPVEYSNLSSFERRIVHLALADNPQVETVSEGEGRDRKLVIKLKDNK